MIFGFRNRVSYCKVELLPKSVCRTANDNRKPEREARVHSQPRAPPLNSNPNHAAKCPIFKFSNKSESVASSGLMFSFSFYPRLSPGRTSIVSCCLWRFLSIGEPVMREKM